MNQELTKEQQDIIDKACKAHQFRSKKETFQAGVDFALSELCPARMEKFAEWIRTFEALERQNGQWVIESQLSDKDIVKAFIEDIKQKDNVQPT